MIYPGDILSYTEMCQAKGYSLQRGMNFKIGGKTSIILMSLRKGAPYADRIEEDGKVLIYEGHDVPRNLSTTPKLVDQPRYSPIGSLTQNGKFYEAAQKYKEGKMEPELVNVYEKIREGIWVYNGVFALTDAWLEKDISRNVFKFKLQVTPHSLDFKTKRIGELLDLDHLRMIPTSVKIKVWKRDNGKCVACGSTDNLHFDHIIPFSKGGTSLLAENIQLLCARHNLQKLDKIS
jgi:hypothetical protein